MSELLLRAQRHGRLTLGPLLAPTVLIGARNRRRGVAAEGLIEGFGQGRCETDLVAEGRQNRAQHRIGRRTRALHVHGLHVKQTASHGQGEEVAANDLRIRLIQQVELTGDGLIRVVGVLNLPRTGNRRRRGQGQQTQLAVALADLARLIARLGIDREEARHRLALGLAAGDEDRGERELGALLARHLHREVVGRLSRRRRHRALGRGRGRDGGRGLLGQPPAVTARVEVRSVLHVVAREQFALNLEHVLRIPHVAHEVAGDLRQGLDAIRVDLHPGLKDRILLVPLEQADRTVIGVHDGLDGVAHVVDRLSAHVLAHGVRLRVDRRLSERFVLRIGVVVRGRVAVDHPHEALGRRGVPVDVDDRRVRLLLEGEEGGDLRDTGQRVADVQDLRSRIRLRGEEDVRRGELDRVKELVPEVADARTAIAGEGGGDLTALGVVIRVIELLRVRALGGAHDRVLRGVRREVDPLLVVAHLTAGGHGLLPVGGQAVGGERIAVRGDDAETVGVDGVHVHPGALLGRQAREVHLAHGDDGVAALIADGVAVDLHARVEAVVGPRLLELLDGLRDDLRVEQADLRGRLRVLAQLTRLRGRRRIVVRVLEALEPVGLQGRIDVVLDVGGFQFALVRGDPELLNERRIHPADDQGRYDGHGDADDRKAPGPLERRDEEEDGDEHRDHREDRMRRQRRLDVGVHGAVHVGAALGEQRVASQPVIRAEQQGGHRGEDPGDVARGLGGVRPGEQADRPVQVGHDDRRREGEERRLHEEGDEEVEGGQREHEEGDVKAELRIRRPEGRAVDELEDGLPLPRQLRARSHAQEKREAPEDDPAERLESLLVLAEIRRGLTARRGGPVPVDEVQGEQDRGGHDEESHEEQTRECEPLGEQHARRVHLLEPQDLRPHARSGVDEADDREENEDRHRTRSDARTVGFFTSLLRRSRKGS